MKINESKNQNFAKNITKNSQKPSEAKKAFRQRLMLKMLFGACVLGVLVIFFFRLINDEYAVIMLIIVALVLIFVFINSPKFKAKKHKKFDDFINENSPQNATKNDKAFKEKSENNFNKFA